MPVFHPIPNSVRYTTIALPTGQEVKHSLPARLRILQIGIQVFESFRLVSGGTARVCRAAGWVCLPKLIRFSIRPCFGLRFWCWLKRFWCALYFIRCLSGYEIFKSVYKFPSASAWFQAVPRESVGQLGGFVCQNSSDSQSGHVSVVDVGVDLYPNIRCFTFCYIIRQKSCSGILSDPSAPDTPRGGG